MDFWDLTKVLFRRWYIAFPLVGLTAAACVMLLYTAEPDYKATAYVQLIPPTAAGTESIEDEIHNPWLDLGLESLNSAANFTTLDSTFLKQLEADGYSNTITITEGYPNPVVTIVIVGSSKEQAMRTTEKVVERFSATVAKLQNDRGVRSNSLISTLRLDSASNLEPSDGKIKRAVIAVAGAGLLVTASLTLAFDTLARRRRRQGGIPGGTAVPRQPETSPVEPRTPPTQIRTGIQGSSSFSNADAIGRRLVLGSFAAESSTRSLRGPSVAVEYVGEVPASFEVTKPPALSEPPNSEPLKSEPLKSEPPKSEPPKISWDEVSEDVAEGGSASPDATIVLPLTFGNLRRGADNGGSGH